MGAARFTLHSAILLLVLSSSFLSCPVAAVRRGPVKKAPKKPTSEALLMMSGGALPTTTARDIRMEQFEATALHETATQQLRDRCLSVRDPASLTIPLAQHY